MKFKIKIKKIDRNIKIKDLTGNELPVYDVNFIQKKPFDKISTKSSRYILECFDKALKLIQGKKIIGLINCPVSKAHLFMLGRLEETNFLINAPFGFPQSYFHFLCEILYGY